MPSAKTEKTKSKRNGHLIWCACVAKQETVDEAFVHCGGFYPLPLETETK